MNNDRKREIAKALLGGINLEPFDPAKHKPTDVGLGGPSTEYLMTEESPDAQFWNIPGIWWDANGKPVMADPDQAWAFAEEYEKRTGRRFPRFNSPGAGSFSAMNRSAMGGAMNGKIAK